MTISGNRKIPVELTSTANKFSSCVGLQSCLPQEWATLDIKQDQLLSEISTETMYSVVS